VLSSIILKEKVGIHRWSALIVRFVGVLIITDPGAGALTYGALFALGNAVLISTVAIAIRRMSMTESTETLTLYQMSIMTLCTAGLLTRGFRAPHWDDALMVALAGVGNGIAQFWWTRSLSLAPPSAVVPFNYLSLVWATILGFAVWGDVPTPGLLVGSAIVVASGLYILWRETLRRRRPAVPAPQRVVPASSGNAGSQTLTLLMGGVSSTEEGIRDNPSNPFRAGGDAPARDEHYICSCKCWLKIKRT
jgi:drug/metabolite transporter (DMT)-like permease